MAALDLEHLASVLEKYAGMDEEDLSLLDSPAFDESGELPYGSASLDKQTASLQTYLDSIPYTAPCSELPAS